MRPAAPNLPRQRLSRADIEMLCILDAVGSGSCTPRELAERLDLATELAAVLVDALQELASAGLLAAPGDHPAGAYTVTEEGRAWAAERLGAAGLAQT